MAEAAGRLRITLVRSVIGHPRDQRVVVRALGLRRIRQTVTRQDTPVLRGMLTRVAHLVRVEAGGH
ncbi:MAG TPA: 50S ribosomal protein L30 [Candidatus Methylomirabilis sp.]|nr:50S ribosomal protein L30 [Candidatus Methylomirabilis sp.]